jgi:hypothetical protein
MAISKPPAINLEVAAACSSGKYSVEWLVAGEAEAVPLASGSDEAGEHLVPVRLSGANPSSSSTRLPKGFRYPSYRRRRSSTAEQLFCKQQVTGSIPVAGSKCRVDDEPGG